MLILNNNNKKQKKNEDTQKRYNKNKFVGSLIFIID